MNTSFRYINPSVLLKSTANNEPAVINLLQVFLRINPSMMAQLEQAFSSRDSVKLNTHAHAIKNSMLLLGASDMAEKINRLEIETRSNEYSFEKTCFELMMQELAAVSHEVESYILLLESFPRQKGGPA